ncbi:MAG: T9SS type A sorting domain-containing protein [Taibaiella sp.]|nr:T9SS type A sorting domain-containing protein [Taibaiella sp.]
MKKFLLIALGFCGMFSIKGYAQATFTTTADTVWASTTSSSSDLLIPDHITGNKIGDSVRVTWTVDTCDFPTDWLATGSVSNLSICDNNICYFNPPPSFPMWGGSSRNTYVSAPYHYHVAADYHMGINLTNATSTGTHFLTAKLTDAVSGYTKKVTFVVTRAPAAVYNVNGNDEISLYPNPARNQVNVVFSAESNVKTISLYNMIGRIVSVYKVVGNSAGIDISTMPSGIYFMRLVDVDGNVIATRKFTHQ